MPPVNDDWANAIDLGSSFSGAISGSNVAATTEVGEPVASASGQPSPAVTVWWKWTCPGTAPALTRIATAGSTFDTVLGIYTGAAVNALTEIASNDDFGAPGVRTSRVDFAPVAGTTYYIQVDGYDATETGSISLSWASFFPPANDDFVNAIDLGSALTGLVRGSNVASTTQVGEPVASDGGRPNPLATVWWKWTCPAGPPAYAAFSTRGSTFDTVLGIYTGASVSTLTEISSNDDSAVAGGGGASQTVFAPVAGTTYYIQVDGSVAGATGAVALSWLAGAIPAPTVTDGHGTGTDTVTFTVASPGYRGVAVVVLGGNFDTSVAGHLGSFTVSPTSIWTPLGGGSTGTVWTATFDDGVPISHLTPTFTAVDVSGNPITPGDAKIAYAWTFIGYATAVQWAAAKTFDGTQAATTAIQVVDPTLTAVLSQLEVAAHYVGIARLFTNALDGSGNPIVLSASADAPLTHEAQDINSGPSSNSGPHDVQELVGIASDVNITPVAGMSGTRTWTTAWQAGYADSFHDGIGVMVRAFPQLPDPGPVRRGGWGSHRFGGPGF